MERPKDEPIILNAEGTLIALNQAAALLFHQLEFTATIPQQDPNPIIRILPTGEVIFANPKGKIIVEYWMSNYSGLPDIILKKAKKIQQTHHLIRIEMEIDRKNYLFTLLWVPDCEHITIYGTDISLLKSAEKHTLELAQLDSLTQIANRHSFEKQFNKKLKLHAREKKQLALLIIDIDNFKIINDTLGHPIGDQLLKATAKRMLRSIRHNDFIARFGGDEFLIILEKSNEDSAVMVAEKIINVLAKPFHFQDHQLTITVSIGIAIYPETGETAGELLKQADRAMYHIKKSGKNNYAVFCKTIHFVQDERNELIKTALKQALRNNQFYIEYQPQMHLHTNAIIGYEAFVRWLHPDLGLLMPHEFIPAAEQTGVIVSVNQWILNQAFHDLAPILASNKNTQLAINISINQLNDPHFIDRLCTETARHNIHKNRIIFDISENTMITQIKKTSAIFNKLCTHNIKIGLDNFGSLAISLPELVTLPIKYLKLDPQLLHHIETHPKNRALLRGIIHLAKELQIEVIQKGIETQTQHRIVASLGCDYAQGFYYCPPLPIKELLLFLHDYP